MAGNIAPKIGLLAKAWLRLCQLVFIQLMMLDQLFINNLNTPMIGNKALSIGLEYKKTLDEIKP